MEVANHNPSIPNRRISKRRLSSIGNLKKKNGRPTRVSRKKTGPNPSPDKKVDSVGRFYVTEPFQTPDHRYRLTQIAEYFTDEVLESILIPLTTTQSDTSLRALDWMVTNYSKKYHVCYRWKMGDSEDEVLISVRDLYRRWLSRWKRVIFDSCRRRQRVYYEYKDLNPVTIIDGCETKEEEEGEKMIVYETTVGQLNFIYWACEYGVLDYVNKNIDKIMKDVADDTAKKLNNRRSEASLSSSQGQKKRKKRELSLPTGQKCFIHKISMNNNPFSTLS